MTRIALGLEYDGRAFCGWQTQPPPLPITLSLSKGSRIGCGVQDALQAALAQIHGAPIATVVAGRTDAGVHATGQVVHFDALHARPESAWVRGVNAHLPRSVAVLWAREVDAEFHARFGAQEREYRYRLLMRPTRPAILAGRVGWVHDDLDVAAMQTASRCLIGTHDFSAFRAAECQAKSPVREMRAVEIRQDGPMLEFCFRANAFLQHQIRNLVGALVWVGQGRRPPDWMAETLASRDRRRAAATFAPDGLYLTAVRYEKRFALPESRAPMG
jgi:tRNA pseudouridine38-40 synthase